MYEEQLELMHIEDLILRFKTLYLLFERVHRFYKIYQPQRPPISFHE